jgi:putative transposase
LWAYVLMPEHADLLVYPGEAPEHMSRFLQARKEPVARKAVAFLQANDPGWLARLTVREGRRLRHRIWQPGGGYDRNIARSSTLRSMIEYLHGNPVRRGLVAKAEDREWSCARWYAGMRPVPIEMDSMVREELSRAGPPWAER